MKEDNEVCVSCRLQRVEDEILSCFLDKEDVKGNFNKTKFIFLCHEKE